VSLESVPVEQPATHGGVSATSGQVPIETHTLGDASPDDDSASVDAARVRTLPLAAEPTLPASFGSAPAAAEPVLVRNLPQRTTADLADRLASVQEATRAWDAAGEVPVAEFRRRARNLYEAWSGLAEVLTAVDQADPQVRAFRDEAQQLLLKISQDAKQSDLIRKVAPAWMAARRPHDGVLLMGTVKSVQMHGDLFETQVRISPDHVVDVVSARDPRQSFQPDTPVLLLGLIVNTPADSIVGYQGSAAVVVLDGFHVALPPHDG
jgi:hypothetical protein